MGRTDNAESLPGTVVVIAGPTATGKSELSLRLADALGSEVVNTDSMQLYRGMDIGTAKLTAEERRGIPHHLLDIWGVRQTANVKQYQELVRPVIDRLLGEERSPILTGGSGLYIQAATDRMEFPGTDPRLRAELEQELAEQGSARLHHRLAEVDPAAAAAILPSNGRRIVRALEVVALTGSFRATLPTPESVYRTVHIALDRDPAELDDRIARRVDLMWERGLMSEVRALTDQGLADGLTASRALGYRQLLDHLRGDLTLEEARERTVSGTRRFVRRQRSWFGRDRRYHWFDATQPDLVTRVLELVRAN
ncbi:tRNA dimethylallyltransferase [Stackebrandtia endophytica]|uniref:tRNA dimethylallyltransferase n=1 Tax=Stackebrandtia endophytica TaxID=1496996 RepID=A0A543B2Y6_9ACTN|nr:tRNA (adenosine(37)-N6)-dimethylallyltransferase MiaA [Stackebrandtia endophytica]TQL79140.1 tRNA dimethylallyltransferase [Stackebrandtia endophytica]